MQLIKVRTSRLGLEVQRLKVLALKESRMGSIVAKTVPLSPPDRSKSVKAAMMQTVESGLISLNALSRDPGAT